MSLHIDVSEDVACVRRGHCFERPAIKRIARPLAVLLALTVGTACSLAVDSDRQQCRSSTDCEAHLGAGTVCVSGVCTRLDPQTADAGEDAADAAEQDPVWGCLDQPRGVPAEEPDVPIVFSGKFQDAISGEPLVGLSLRACKGSDGTCSQPIADSTTRTNAEGSYEVRLYSGFQGYLELLPSETNADVMPSTMLVLPIPDKRFSADGRIAGLTVGLMTKTQFSFIAATAGKEVFQDYGHVFFFTSTCESRKAGANVSVRAEPVSASTLTWYLDNAGTPSLTQSSTSDSGNGGFINLPPGNVTLTGSLPDGRRIPSREVHVRAGAITFLNMAAF